LTKTTRAQTKEAEVGEAGDTVATEAGVRNARGGVLMVASLHNFIVTLFALYM